MLNKLASLHKLCFPDRPWSADEFASLQRAGAEIMASENGFVVWRCAAGECEIITIGVHPARRGEGIADALLRLVEKEVRGRRPEIKDRKIFLEVAENNAAALKLYERNGYRRIAIRPKYYDGVDAVVMSKGIQTAVI
jgi:ribosomal-protein-alanine N-acetyltransferase